MVFVWMKNQKGNKQPEACLNESWKVAFFLAEVQGAGWQHYPFLIDNNCFWLTLRQNGFARTVVTSWFLHFTCTCHHDQFLRIGLEVTPTKHYWLLPIYPLFINRICLKQLFVGVGKRARSAFTADLNTSYEKSEFHVHCRPQVPRLADTLSYIHADKFIQYIEYIQVRSMLYIHCRLGLSSKVGKYIYSINLNEEYIKQVLCSLYAASSRACSQIEACRQCQYVPP